MQADVPEAEWSLSLCARYPTAPDANSHTHATIPTANKFNEASNPDDKPIMMQTNDFPLTHHPKADAVMRL